MEEILVELRIKQYPNHRVLEAFYATNPVLEEDGYLTFKRDKNNKIGEWRCLDVSKLPIVDEDGSEITGDQK